MSELKPSDAVRPWCELTTDRKGIGLNKQKYETVGIGFTQKYSATVCAFKVKEN